MEFEWDDEKNTSNLLKHGIGFETAIAIFRGPTLTRTDDRKDYGEVRDISIGTLNGEVVVTMVHTDRQGITRIVSARRASKEEREVYYEHIQKDT